MIIDYDKKYDEDIKNLLVELQIYIASIDEEGYNVVTKDFKEKYFWFYYPPWRSCFSSEYDLLRHFHGTYQDGCSFWRAGGGYSEGRRTD